MSDNGKVNTGHNIEDKELIRNARKPEGELGHQILDRMNQSHESMAQWGVSHFKVCPDSKILDIGCGGGRNIERFAAQISENGRVVGIDYSATCFETVYFWPDFINDLKEVNRVLKKDGFIFICNEAVYREGQMDKYDDLVELLDMKIYSEDVLKESLESAGFKDFKSYIDDENDWICVIAHKA